MAKQYSRLPQNVPGPWYVMSSCVDCYLCLDVVPSVFRRDEAAGACFVFHQPETEEELERIEEAKAACPVEAIAQDEPPVTGDIRQICGWRGKRSHPRPSLPPRPQRRSNRWKFRP